MKRTKLWGSLLFLAVFCGGACDRQDSARRRHTANQGGVRTFRAQLPLSFEANDGQADERVKFLARGGGYSLALTANAAVLTMNSQRTQSAQRERSKNSSASSATSTFRLRTTTPLALSSLTPCLFTRPFSAAMTATALSASRWTPPGALTSWARQTRRIFRLERGATRQG
jgi:hypothetical protein